MHTALHNKELKCVGQCSKLQTFYQFFVLDTMTRNNIIALRIRKSRNCRREVGKAKDCFITFNQL